MEQETAFSSHILEALGSKSSLITIVASASLAVICLFYVFTVGTYLQIRIYPLVDRVTYISNFNFFIVNEFVDHVVIGSLFVIWLIITVQTKIGRIITITFAVIIAVAACTEHDAILDGTALTALPLVFLLLVCNRYFQKTFDFRSSRLTISYISVIGIVIGLASFSIAVSSLVFPDSDSSTRDYAYEIFLLFSSFSPILILILITSFPIKLMINFVLNVTRKTSSAIKIYDETTAVSITSKIVYLSIFVFLSILMVIIPHLPFVNRNGEPISADTRVYSIWLTELNESGNFQEYFSKTFIEINNGDRPISLMLIHVFQQVLTVNGNIDPLLAIECLSLLLGPSLVLVVYFFARELTTNDKVALFAAFITSISFQMLIGVYAGFYSNWISLIFGYLSFVFLFRFLSQQGMANLVLYGVLLTLTLFTHVYTWSILAIAIGVFLGICFTKWNPFMQSNTTERKDARKSASLLLVILLSTVAIDIARVAITGSSGGIEADLELGRNLAGLEQFAFRWNNLTYGTTIYVGGLFANSIILGLGLYWLIFSRIKEKQNILMLVFFSIGILPFLFGEWIIQTRVFYNIPFQIPAALALFDIHMRKESILKIAPIYILLITVPIIVIGNFYLVLPT